MNTTLTHIIISTIAFVSYTKQTDAINPKTKLGSDTEFVSMVNYLEDAKEIKKISEITDTTVLLLFVIHIKITGEKIEIKPFGSDNGYHNSDKEFHFELVPAEQQIQVIKAQVKGKKNIMKLFAALLQYQNFTVGPKDIFDYAIENLEAVWAEVTTHEGTESTKMVKSSEAKIIKDSSLKTALVGSLKEYGEGPVILMGEKAVLGVKPGISMSVFPWAEETYTRLIPVTKKEDSIKGGSINCNFTDPEEKGFNIEIHETDKDRAPKLLKIFEKKGNSGTADDEEDSPFYKTWWFITIMIVIAIVVLVGVALIFRRSMLGKGGRRGEK